MYERVLATEHAPRGPFRVFERRDGLAEIVERGGGVPVERIGVNLLRGGVPRRGRKLTRIA